MTLPSDVTPPSEVTPPSQVAPPSRVSSPEANSLPAGSPGGIGTRIITLWERLSPLPFGRSIFSFLLGRMVPYSGSVAPRVLTLQPGHVVVALRDRRHVRNHLRSVHAVALTNVAELSSGLALTLLLPSSVRGIVLGLEMEFLKKARGRLLATSKVEVPAEVREGTLEGPVDYDVGAEITDQDGEVVARATVRWRLGPR